MRNIPLIIEDEINNVNIEEISTSKTIKKEEMKKFEEENPLIENIEKIMENREKELSPDCFSGADNAPSELLNKFINIDINILTPLLNPRNSFFIKLSTEKIMSWQNKEIDIPFLKMTDNLKPISIQIFRNLLSYMKDRKSSKQPIFHIRKFLKLTLHSEQIIKDEAYIQIYKQLQHNKSYESLLRGWKFLAIISSCFVPSDNIYYLILNFLFFAMQNNDDVSIVNHAKFIFVRMIRTKEKERKNVPCSEEIEYIENLKSISIPLYFFTGNQTNVNIESYTTVKDLKKKMMNFLEFNPQRSIYYSLYEIGKDDEGSYERFIDDSEIVCDILAFWKSEKLKAEKKNKSVDFKLYLKLLIYYPIEEEDYDTVTLLYYQTKFDVITGKFNLNANKIINLGGLQLLNEFGNEREEAYNYLKKNYEKYVPLNKLNLMTQSQWIEKIIEFYSSISSFPKKEAKWNYLEELKEDKLYQTQQFHAKFNFQKSGTNEDNIPDDCLIGFKPNGIIILDNERNEIVFYKYEIIMNWGISTDQFIICISNVDSDIKKVCFFTSQTKVIQHLIEIYCNIIAGKDIKEIQNIIQTYDKKFEKIDSGRKRFRTIYKKKEIRESKLSNNEEDSIVNENSQGMSELI